RTAARPSGSETASISEACREAIINASERKALGFDTTAGPPGPGLDHWAPTHGTAGPAGPAVGAADHLGAACGRGTNVPGPAGPLRRSLVQRADPAAPRVDRSRRSRAGRRWLRPHPSRTRP